MGVGPFEERAVGLVVLGTGNGWVANMQELCLVMVY